MNTIHHSGSLATYSAHHHKTLHIKDPASCLTHLAGMILSLLAAPFLLTKAFSHEDTLFIVSASLYITSMIFLYMASASYHAISEKSRFNMLLKKADHIMIYFLIAGSYTPICLLVLPQESGRTLFHFVWGFACAGFLLTAFWVTSPKWLNSCIYIAMGWLCIFSFRQIVAGLSSVALFWLVAGGVIYTVGGIIYALKLPLFNSIHKGFGSHEIFHLFVLVGSLCHFILIYFYLF